MNAQHVIDASQFLVLVVLLVRGEQHARAKRKNDALERAELGRQYAQLGVALALRRGGTKAELRRIAQDGFRVADETADAKRDFSDAQALVYIEAAFAEAGEK